MLAASGLKQSNPADDINDAEAMLTMTVLHIRTQARV